MVEQNKTFAWKEDVMSSRNPTGNGNLMITAVDDGSGTNLYGVVAVMKDNTNKLIMDFANNQNRIISFAEGFPNRNLFAHVVGTNEISSDVFAILSKSNTFTGNQYTTGSEIIQSNNTDTGFFLVPNTGSGTYPQMIQFISQNENFYWRVYRSSTDYDDVFYYIRDTNTYASEVFLPLTGGNMKASINMNKTSGEWHHFKIHETDSNSIKLYLNEDSIGLFMYMNNVPQDILLGNRATGAYSSTIFAMRTGMFMNSVEHMTADELVSNKKEIQDKIIELEFKHERALAKGFTELSDEIEEQLTTLNEKLQLIA